MKQGWQSKKLGEICEVLKRGISPKYLESGGICVLNQKCIRNHAVNFAPSRRHNINVKKVPDERFIQLGDVLVNSTGTGTLGRVAQIRELPSEKTTVDSHVTIVRPIKDLFHLDFFGYTMILIEEEIKNAGEGCGGQTELARSTLAERFLVRFPETKTEQKRIVALLDDAFEAIDISIENTKKNLQDARELFHSELNKLFAEKGLNWKEKSLGQIAKINYGYTESASNEAVGPKFLRITDIQDNQVDWDNVPYCKIEDSELAKYVLVDGDIVFARTGATTGKSYLVRTPPKSVFASYLIRLQLDSNIILPPFLHLFFQTGLYWNSIKCGSSGSAQGGFNATKLKALVIPYPNTLDEQLSLVKKFESLSLSIHQLESTYQKKLTALEELKKSLLHQAFSGEL